MVVLERMSDANTKDVAYTLGCEDVSVNVNVSADLGGYIRLELSVVHPASLPPVPITKGRGGGSRGFRLSSTRRDAASSGCVTWFPLLTHISHDWAAVPMTPVEQTHPAIRSGCCYCCCCCCCCCWVRWQCKVAQPLFS